MLRFEFVSCFNNFSILYIKFFVSTLQTCAFVTSLSPFVFAPNKMLGVNLLSAVVTEYQTY